MICRLPLLWALLLAVLAGPATAQPAPVAPPGGEDATSDDGVPVATLTVTLDPTVVAIGDRFQARLDLRLAEPLAAPPRFPVWDEHWGDAEILAVEPPHDDGGGRWSQHLTLAVFETGLATLPAAAVQVPAAGATSTVSSPPAVVQVDSVLPAGQDEITPQPPEPVHALPLGRVFWIAAGLLGLAVLALGSLVWRRVRRIDAALQAAAMSPLEAFAAALARLRGEERPVPVYTGLSLELRRYLGRRLAFPAAEGTTTEVQRSLRDRRLPPELVRDTLGLLREADQIKFARGAADAERARRRVDDAERLAAAVEDWLRPATPSDEAAA